MAKKEKRRGHASENTITGFVAEEIKKAGIDNSEQYHFPTPHGPRSADIMCIYEGFNYPCEAKFSDRPRDLVKDIVKIENDYLPYGNELKIKCAFIALYPKELEYVPIDKIEEEVYKSTSIFTLMVIRSDVRDVKTGTTYKAMEEFKGTIIEIAKLIVDNIVNPLPIVQKSDFTTRKLKECADVITEGLKALSKDKLKSMIGGDTIFEHIIEYGGYSKKARPEEIYEQIRIESAYILINQLLFYRMLSAKSNGLDVINVNKLSTPEELQTYFDKIVNYKTIYGFKIASHIPLEFFGEVKGIIAVIELLAPERITGDVLGTIFHNLISSDLRKRVAAFYTNQFAAKLLATLTINKPDAVVGDFASGCGTIPAAMYNRKVALTTNMSGMENLRILNEIYAVDVMPFAASITASNLSIQKPEYPIDHVNVATFDSTELEPNCSITSFISSHVGAPSFFKNSGNQGNIVFPMLDAAAMNPPYTKNGGLSQDYKSKLTNNFKDYKKYIDNKMGLYGYFIFLADKFLKARGNLGVTIPANSLRIFSLRGVRQLLKDKYTIQHIIASVADRSAFSENAQLREIILVASKQKPEKDDKVFVSLIKIMPDTHEKADVLIDLIKSKKEIDNHLVKIDAYPIKDFYESDNWYRFMSIVNTNLMEFANEMLNNEKLVPITDFVEPLTNTLSYFSIKSKGETFHGFLQKGFMKNKIDQWKVIEEKDNYITVQNIFNRKIVNIDRSKLYRAFRRPAQLKRMKVDDDADYLIIEYFKGIEELAAPLIGVDEAKEITESDVRRWKLKAIENASRISYAYKVDLTAPGTSHVAFYSETPLAGLNIRSLRTKISKLGRVPKLTRDEEKVVVLWLNSTFGILNLLRERNEVRGGYFSNDCYIFDDIFAPDMSALTESEKREIAALLDKIGDIEMPSILEQLQESNPIRREIDELFMRILGINYNLYILYPKVLNEIEILKNMMST